MSYPVSSEGIEPSSRIPQTRVLSIKLRGQNTVIARSSAGRRGNPVTMHEEFNHGIASSPSRSLRSLRLLAMTDISIIYSSSSIHKNLHPINIPHPTRFYFQNQLKFLSVLLPAKNIPRLREYNADLV